MEVARKVPDLITKEPPSDPFSVLKKRILNEFEPTSSEKLNKLFKGCELGDRKPSALLREMRQFAVRATGAKAVIEFLRDLFCTYGVPERIISDRDPVFTSNANKNFFN